MSTTIYRTVDPDLKTIEFGAVRGRAVCDGGGASHHDMPISHSFR